MQVGDFYSCGPRTYTFTESGTGNPITWMTATSINDLTVTFTIDPLTPSEIGNWSIEMVVTLTNYPSVTASNPLDW